MDEKISVDQIEPTGKRLLMSVFRQVTQTSSGFVISEGDGHATPVLGTVIRAGADSRYKPGDKLMWRRYSLDILKVDFGDGEQEYALLEEDDVVAKVGITENK